MDRSSSLIRNLQIFLLVALGLFLGVRASAAQTQPSDLPRDLISTTTVPYEQGMANIIAKDAARPKAVQPILANPPGSPSSPSNTATKARTAPTDVPPVPK